MKFGLIGKSLQHSFSKNYFNDKFKSENLIHHHYENIELMNISEFCELSDRLDYKGFNVTFPYKESIIPCLDEIDPLANSVGAVNCIKVSNKKLIGFNTDVYGFKQSIKPFLEPNHNKALIFGTGGSSKAVAYALQEVGVDYYYVTRQMVKKHPNTFFYSELNEWILNQFLLLINCSPVGMFPNSQDELNVPYTFVGANHLAYDLIYNPTETLFLKKCKQQGANVMNGLSMLQLQAEKSWEIWNR